MKQELGLHWQAMWSELLFRGMHCCSHLLLWAGVAGAGGAAAAATPAAAAAAATAAAAAAAAAAGPGPLYRHLTWPI